VLSEFFGFNLRELEMDKVANRRVRDYFEWGIAHEGRFATPADSPLRDGSPCRGLRV
jgi:hypothetical protein